MKDPYSVLGISKDATEQEIKDAYRELARKYHPDNYADNPLSDLASEKMKEINEAYDEIMNSRRSGKGKNNNKANENYNTKNSNFPEVRSLISQGRYEQAQEVLDGVPIESRIAEWYFLNGTVLFRRGWFDQAYTSFATACRMEPDNAEYRDAYNRAQAQSRGQYNPYSRSYGATGGCDACDVCQALMCANCCCRCMGADMFYCC